VKVEHLPLSRVKKTELFDFMKETRNKEEYRRYVEKHDIISVFDLIKHNQLETLQRKAGSQIRDKYVRVAKEELYVPFI
jgi:hypothetical protein